MEREQKGFTIIELLVAMAILGLLIAVMIPGIAVVQRGARNTARRTGAQAIQGLIEDYYGSKKTYPTDITVASCTIPRGQTSCTPTCTQSSGKLCISNSDIDSQFKTLSALGEANASCGTIGKTDFKLGYTDSTNTYSLMVCMEGGEAYTLTTK